MLRAFFLREDSPLRVFKVKDEIEEFLTNRSVHSFLAAVAESKLESFSIGPISSQRKLKSLANIIPAMKVKELAVSFCPNLDSFKTHSFNTFLRAVAKSNLEGFSIGNVSSQQQLGSLANIIPAMKVKELAVSVCPNLKTHSFNTFLWAVAKSNLESFSIGPIFSQRKLKSLANIIPAMTLTELHVAVRPKLNSLITRESLLEAVGNNFCQLSVQGTVLQHPRSRRRGSRHDLFADAEDKQRLEFYKDRNQRLEEWVTDPAPVREDVWPEALELAGRAGPNTLYQSMLALSNFGVGLTAAQRELFTE